MRKALLLLVLLVLVVPIMAQRPGGSGVRVNGAEIVWDDLVAPAGAINPLGADGQMTLITDPADYIGCLKATSVGETAVIQFQLSHGTMRDSDLHPHVHYIKNGADYTGTVAFEAKFRHCPLTGSCGAWSAFVVGTSTVTPADAANAVGLARWALADTTYNFDISSILVMQVKLSATAVTSVAVCSADVHYQRTSMGSRTENAR